MAAAEVFLWRHTIGAKAHGAGAGGGFGVADRAHTAPAAAAPATKAATAPKGPYPGIRWRRGGRQAPSKRR